MNQAKAAKIVQGVAERYRKDRNVLGVMLFGSTVKGTFDEFSDVDIFILLGKKSGVSRENFIQDNLRVDTIFNTKGETLSCLKHDKNNLRRITSHMLAHGRILYRLWA